MQKTTKDLLKRLKELRPSIHGVTHIYGTNWKTDELEETFYLDLPEPVRCKTEKELQDLIRKYINSTESDLGFRFPHSVKLLNLNDNGSPPTEQNTEDESK